MDWLSDSLALVEALILEPNQRLFYGYFGSALLLSVWVYWRAGTLRAGLETLTSRDTWWSRSARLDYQLIISNAVFKVALLGNFVFLGTALSAYVASNLSSLFGSSGAWLGGLTGICAYTIVHTVLDDLAVYWVHRLQHRLPLLWSFHQVHHSATSLTPFTQLRIHPVELVVNNLRGGIVFGVVSGSFVYLTGGHISPLSFLGVNVFAFMFFAFGANLRHSPVGLKYWRPLEHVLISPKQHQIHHSISVDHHDRNFGSKFALWDWAFGTLYTSEQTEQLTFGLTDNDLADHTLASAILSPFVPDEAPSMGDEASGMGEAQP